MFLVVDTNVLFSLFRKGSKINELIRDLRRKGFKLLAPEFAFLELKAIAPKISKFSGLTSSEIEEALISLKKVIKEVAKAEYSQFLEEASKISPHKKDAPLFALSLAFNKAPIWSREPKLKRQKAIKVLSDKEIEELLKESSE
jgi:predicted nucleic acid-binding protein